MTQLIEATQTRLEWLVVVISRNALAWVFAHIDDSVVAVAAALGGAAGVAAVVHCHLVGAGLAVIPILVGYLEGAQVGLPAKVAAAAITPINIPPTMY